MPVPDIPNSLICSAWAEAADTSCAASVNEDLLAWMLLVASETLYVLSGRQFRGAGCEATVRPSFPCGVDYGGCGGPMEVTLPHYPVTEVTEVRVRQNYNGDLEILDPDQYELVNHSTLVRLKDADGIYRSWPQQDVRQPSTGNGRFFDVTYTYGSGPPTLGRQAAADLACEFVLAADPTAAAACRLPRNVQSIVRQGISAEFVDTTALLEQDLTGVYTVDLFLKTFNPQKLRRRASVWSPDLPTFR